MATVTINRRFIFALAFLLALFVAAVTVSPIPAPQPTVIESSASIVDFTQYPAGSARKQAFVAYFLPIISAVNAQIIRDRVKLLALQDKRSLSYFDNAWLQELAARYRMREFRPSNMLHWVELVKRVDAVSPSLALAQSANESAWGTSRFARVGNNFFGQWCFETGCGMVPKARAAGAGHEVKVFDSATAAVEAYMRNLNTHKAYRELREIRAQRRHEKTEPHGVDLAEGLVAYSSRGLAYVSELQHMINYNEWQQYDLIRL